MFQTGNCTKKHKPGCANCPARESIYNKCGHTGHWQAKCRGDALLAGSLTRLNPPGGTDNKGRKVGLTLLILMNMTANMMRLTCTQSMIILMRSRWTTW